MENLDSILEQYLKELERGVTLDKILRSLPPEHAELAPLLRVAAQTRVTQHPQMSDSLSRVQRGRVTQVARAARESETRKARATGSSRLPWLLVPAGLSALAVIAVLVVVGVAFAFAGPTSAHAATLMDVKGIVEVSSPDNPTDFQLVSEGDQVKEGSQIRTLADSSATLLYYEGSRSMIGPYSDLFIQQLAGAWGNVIKVQLRQLAGETTSSVVPFRGRGSVFEVITPAGQATVHGTIFNVNIAQNGVSNFAVDRGVVNVTYNRSNVILTAGQGTAVDPSGIPATPSYTFMITGTISKIDGTTWTISGQSITVPAELAATLHFSVGDVVVVRGRILDGAFVADSISLAEDEETQLTFTGTVDSIGADFWMIGGNKVFVNGGTDIDDNIQKGDAVKVTYVIREDGSWLAKDINKLNEEEQPTPTATATPTDTSTPTPAGTLTDTPEVSETPTVTLTPSMTPAVSETPVPTATLEGNRGFCQSTDRQHPEGLRLAKRFGVDYREIMKWFCMGYGFGEIDLAYGLANTYGIPVEDVFALRASGLGWGQVKHQLQAQATPVPNQQGPSNNGNGNGKGNGNGNGKGNGKP